MGDTALCEPNRAPSGRRIRVLVVEGAELVRQGLIERLWAHPDIEVVAEAGSDEAAIEEATRHAPDVAVLDAQLPDSHWPDLCHRIGRVSPNTRCVVHTGTHLDSATAGSVGAAAVVTKQLLGDRLHQTVIKVAQ